VLVSLAGPGVNIVLALLAAFVFRRMTGGGTVREFVLNVGYANVLLAAFNLIPIPPLDGSAVIERFLPRAWWPRYMQIRQYSMGILLILVLLLPQVLARVFDFALRLWLRLL
jgi:Zn-dependent protease